MDRQQTQEAKDIINRYYKDYLTTVEDGHFSDAKVKAFLFGIFVAGRLQVLQETQSEQGANNENTTSD